MPSSYTRIKNYKITLLSSETKLGKDLSGGIDKIKVFFDAVKTAIDTVMKVLSPFLKAISGGPLTAIYNLLLKTIGEFLDSLIATGVFFIIVTPFNQKQKRKIAIKVNMLNPIEEYKELMSNISIIDTQYNVKKEIETLENDLLTTSNESLRENKLKQLQSKQTQLQQLQISDENTKMFTMNDAVTFPKLSVTDAIDELIDSFSNQADVYRPKWNQQNTVTAMGFILSATTQVELLNNLNALNKVFNLSDLTDNYARMKQNMDSWGKALKKDANERADALKEDGIRDAIDAFNDQVNYEVTAYSATQQNADIKATKRAYSADLLKKNLEALSKKVYPFDSATFGGAGNAPQWIPFSVEIIPFVKEVKTSIMDFLDIFTTAAEATDGIFAALAKGIIQKINSLLDIITQITEMLEFMKSLQFGLSCTAFMVNDLSGSAGTYSIGGGVPFLIEELKKLRKLDADLIDQTSFSEAQKQEVAGELALLAQSDFSVLICMAMGSTDWKAVQVQFKKIQDLFNLHFGALASTDTAIGVSTTPILEVVDFSVTPNSYTDPEYSMILNHTELQVLLNQNCKRYYYQILTLEQYAVKDTITKTIINVQNGVYEFIIPLNGLKSDTKYVVIIGAIGLTTDNIMTKTYKFRTISDSLSNDLTLSPDGGVTNNSDQLSNGVILLPSGDTFDFTLLPGTTFDPSLFIVAGSGVYTVKVYLDNDRTLYISTDVKHCEDYITFQKNSLLSGKLYIKTSIPYHLYIPASFGEYASITFSDRTEIIKLPSCINIDQEQFTMSFYKGGVWSKNYLITTTINLNLADYCFTLE